MHISTILVEYHESFESLTHYYSVFLYGLLTFNWALTTDFKQMYRYTKQKLAYGKFPNPVGRLGTVLRRFRTCDEYLGNDVGDVIAGLATGAATG